MDKLTPAQEGHLRTIVERYQKKDGMTSMMLEESKWAHIEMANGRDGSALMSGNIRQDYYKGYPNAFFQEVCQRMGWDWKGQSY